MDKIQDIENLFEFTYQYSFLIPLLILVFFYKKLKTEWVVWVIVAYCLLFFFLNFYFDLVPKNLRKLYYIFFTSFEFTSFAGLLFLLVKQKTFRQTILSLSAAFLVFQILYSVSEKFKILDSVPIGVESIVIFIFIFILFYEQFKNSRTQAIYNSSWFWIATGIMLYLSGSFFFNILINNIDPKLGSEYWYFTYIFETLKNIFFSIALLFLLRQQKDNNILKSNSVPFLDMIP